MQESSAGSDGTASGGIGKADLRTADCPRIAENEPSMGEYNKVILMGNLTRDPDLRYTPAGLAVCEFPLAVHHRYRLHDEVKEDVCYVDIVAFGRVGERSKEHLHKGSRVLVDGRLIQRRWESSEGQKRSKHEVVANAVQFIDLAGPAPGQDEDLPL